MVETSVGFRNLNIKACIMGGITGPKWHPNAVIRITLKKKSNYTKLVTSNQLGTEYENALNGILFRSLTAFFCPNTDVTSITRNIDLLSYSKAENGDAFMAEL
jgi:hypothetical protein